MKTSNNNHSHYRIGQNKYYSNISLNKDKSKSTKTFSSFKCEAQWNQKEFVDQYSRNCSEFKDNYNGEHRRKSIEASLHKEK